MKKTLVAAMFVLILGVAALVTGCFQQMLPPPSVDYYVTPDEIVEEFRADEFAATAKYDNKTISVSGYVTNKDFSDSGEPYVGLKKSPDSGGLVMDGVVCVFPRSSLSELTSIEKDDYLSIVGEFDHYGVQVAGIIVRYIVQLKDCRLP